MFWIVEYDNGYCSDYEGEEHLDVCRKYFQNEKNAKEFYNAEKKRLSSITDKGFDNVQIYCEFFADQLLTNFFIYSILIIEREVMLMTNEEKFSKGIVIYKTEDDVICELQGASTKHADVIYSMNRDIKNELFHRCQFADDPDYDIFQWLLYVASRQTWKTTARKIVKIALNEWY